MATLTPTVRRRILLSDDDGDFDEVKESPAPVVSSQQLSPLAAFRSYAERLIETSISAERRVWDDLRNGFDKDQGDRWYQWWGKKEWRAWLNYILLKCTIADSGLHGCVIYSAQGCTSYRYQTGYGKWMYRQEADRPSNWDSTRVPLPGGKESEQVHRLLAYLCATDETVRYAIGHPQKPVRDEAKWKDRSPLILVHLCNNGDMGCVNPRHILFSDALENAARNGCKHGMRMLCPHTPKCIFVDKTTGAIIPWRNVDQDAVSQLTHSQLLSLSHSSWLTEHCNRRAPEGQPRSVLAAPMQRQKRYRNSQAGYMRKRRAKKRVEREEETSEEEKENEVVDLLDDDSQ